MINAKISKKDGFHIEVQGSLPELMTETAIVLAHMLVKLSEKSGAPINVITEGIGMVLPDIVNTMVKEGINE